MFVILLAGLGLTFGAAPPARSAGQTELARRIAFLIEQLGDDSFDKREEADKALKAIGKPAVRPLLTAAATSKDPEVRTRAEGIVQAIAARVPGLMQKAEELHRLGWNGIHAFNTSFSPDGRFWIAGGDGSTLRVFEVKTGKTVQDFVGHSSFTQQAVFSPDNKQVLSASTDGTLRLWNLATGKEVRKIVAHQGGCLSVDLTRDGKLALSAGGDKTIRLWNLSTGKEIRKFEGHTAGCLASFSPDGKQILSSGFDNTMRLWDAATAKEVRKFEGHTAILFGAFFLPDGKQALSYSADQTARVWDLTSGKEVRKMDLGPRLSDIRGLALSPDGKRILVGNDWPSTVRVLEIATGKEVHRFSLVTNPRGLSFSRDGRFAASGSHRGIVYLWRLPGIFDLD